MRAKAITDPDGKDLSAHHLSPETFELIYKTIARLKFPTDVAQVLELRYLINQAVDSFPEPATTPDYRDFCDALQNVIDSSGIDNKRHQERLLRILVMMRELHYTYSINKRDEEARLRAQMLTNRQRRRQAIRYSLIYTMAAIISVVLWIGLSHPDWIVQAVATCFAIGAWLHVRSLPTLDRRLKGLDSQMSALQRHRVKSIHWHMLAQKLALVLGFKRNSEIEVFRFDSDPDQPISRMRH